MLLSLSPTVGVALYLLHCFPIIFHVPTSMTTSRRPSCLTRLPILSPFWWAGRWRLWSFSSLTSGNGIYFFLWRHDNIALVYCLTVANIVLILLLLTDLHSFNSQEVSALSLIHTPKHFNDGAMLESVCAEHKVVQLRPMRDDWLRVLSIKTWWHHWTDSSAIMSLLIHDEDD